MQEKQYNLQEVKKNLEHHGFEVMVFEDKSQVQAWFKKDFPLVGIVGRGGSVTLDELEVESILAGRGITVYYHANFEPEERPAIMDKCHHADVYLSSANALIASGAIFNVDALGNRVSALLHGPKQAIYVIGKNKIVDDYNQAVERLEYAAPKNAARLNYPAGCLKTGKCIDCNSPKRICNAYTILQRPTWAVKSTVILVNEDLGY